MVPFIWRLRGRLVRLTCPLFFERVGAGTMFAGRVRLVAECMVGDSVLFQTGRASEFVISNDVSLNTGTHMAAASSIRIGTAIGEYVSIRDQDHRLTPGTDVRG